MRTCCGRSWITSSATRGSLLPSRKKLSSNSGWRRWGRKRYTLSGITDRALTWLMRKSCSFHSIGSPEKRSLQGMVSVWRPWKGSSDATAAEYGPRGRRGRERYFILLLGEHDSTCIISAGLNILKIQDNLFSISIIRFITGIFFFQLNAALSG